MRIDKELKADVSHIEDFILFKLLFLWKQCSFSISPVFCIIIIEYWNAIIIGKYKMILFLLSSHSGL